MPDHNHLISVRNVGLRYKRHKGLFTRGHGDIWALHDVSFDVFDGEKLGVVGRNGCGKSTLMRVIAGIYQPDRGSVTYHRQVHVQLLSLGVGFEGSLSGRENAVLNGMLLGKSRAHMIERAERIKAFSELGDFFDYPVYTYSSGMNARLGFSVAMETEPDVLLIDEVLGVGDAGFAMKSQKAIEEKFSSDRTVILISHNTETIKQMCTRAVWVEKGRTILEGHPKDVTREYIGQLNREAGIG